MCARCRHRAFTLLRHLPPLKMSYSVPVVGRKKAGKKRRRGRGAGAHHKTACCCAGDGVKGHRELDLLCKSAVQPCEGPVWRRGSGNIQQGTVLPVSPPHVTLWPGRGQRTRGGGSGGEVSSSLSRGRRLRVLRLEWSESRASACYMLQQKLVLFSQSHRTLT